MIRILFQKLHSYFNKLPLIALFFLPPFIPLILQTHSRTDQNQAKNELQTKSENVECGINYEEGHAVNNIHENRTLAYHEIQSRKS